MPKFKPCNYDQMILLPISLENQLVPDSRKVQKEDSRSGSVEIVPHCLFDAFRDQVL